MLRELNPAAERNIAETRAELAEEAQLLDRVVLEALDGAGADAGAVAIARRGARGLRARRCGGSRCARSPSAPAGARSRWAGRARPRSCASPARPRAARSTSAAGCAAICEPGLIRFAHLGARTPAPEPVALRVPGQRRFGRWEVRAELHPGAGRRRRARTSRRSTPRRSAASSRCAPGARATASARSAWRGTKTLQDLFTDRAVPRSLRHALPGGHRRRRGRVGRRRRRLRATSGSSPAPSEVAVLSARALEDSIRVDRARGAATRRPRDRRDPRLGRRPRAAGRASSAPRSAATTRAATCC